VAATLEAAPASATVTIGNSTPIRDCDRFAATADPSLTVIGNRGASGIDGTISTALGAGHAAGEPAVCVLGDLAAHHDSNALLAVDRCDVDATIVVINNDGGGIFHQLPIADFEPFERRFRTPHGLSFGSIADQYDLGYESVAPAAFRSTYREAVRRSRPTIVEVATDSRRHHEQRATLQEAVRSTLGS